jgi:hypothetical protein
MTACALSQVRWSTSGVLAGIGDALVTRLAKVHVIRKYLVDGTLRPRLAAADTGGAGRPLRDLTRCVQLTGDAERRAGLGEAVEDPANQRRLALDYVADAALIRFCTAALLMRSLTATFAVAAFFPRPPLLADFASAPKTGNSVASFSPSSFLSAAA